MMAQMEKQQSEHNYAVLRLTKQLQQYEKVFTRVHHDQRNNPPNHLNCRIELRRNCLLECVSPQCVEFLKEQLAKANTKKSLFGFGGKNKEEKDRHGPRDKEYTSKIRKLQQELESSRQEVMELQKKLSEVERRLAREHERNEKKSHQAASLNYHDSASSSLSDSSHQEPPASTTNSVSWGMRKI